MGIRSTSLTLSLLLMSSSVYGAAIKGLEEGSQVAYCKQIDYVGGSQTLTASGLNCTLTSTAGSGGGDFASDGSVPMSGDITLENGEKIDNGTDGTVCLQGVGGTYNNDICFDLSTYSNQLSILSTTGAHTLRFESLILKVTDDQLFSFGDGADTMLAWETGDTNDSYQIGVGVGTAAQSGYISIMGRGDMDDPDRSPSATSADPVLRVYSSDGTNASDYIEMYHNQSNGELAVAAGGLDISLADTQIRHQFNGTTGMGYTFNPTTDEYKLGVSDSAGNQVIITNSSVIASDFDHAATTNPTLFIHSDTSPDTDNTEYGSLEHSGTGTGDGSFNIDSGTGSICLGGVDGTNNEDLCFDMESNANRITLSSNTSVSRIDFSTLQQRVNDGLAIYFGTGDDTRISYTAAGNDNLQIITKVGSATASGYVSLVENGDAGNANRSPSGTSDDPVLRVYSSDATQANDYIEMYHNQIYGYLSSPSIIRFASGNGRYTFNDDTTAGFMMLVDSTYDQTGYALYDVAGNQLLITNSDNQNKDHDHATTTNPTLFIHSDTNPDTANDEWISFTHDVTDGVIDVGSGGIKMPDLVSCDTIDTDANGLLSCGTDAGSAGGDSWGDPVDADIIPDGDNTRDLGSVAASFADIFWDGTATGNVTGTLTGNADTVTTITGLAPDTATTQATQASITTAANLVTVGALNSGSITSGFGAIDNGASNITSTGVIDFGGATSTEIVNGASPTVNAAGEVAIDTTTDQFIYYGGAKRTLPYYKEKCVTLETPVDADDDIMFFQPRKAITITDVVCRVDGGTSIPLTISDGSNALEAITCATTATEDDGSITNGTFTALERMEFDLGTPTGTQTWLNFCITYTVDAD